MTRLRSWSERIHELKCVECRRRIEHLRLMADRLEVVEPEPTEEQIDAWLIGSMDDNGGAA